MEPSFIILIFVAVAVILIVANIHQERVRLKFWQDLAHRWQFQYRSGDPYSLTNRTEFPFFNQGHGKRIEHLIEGSQGDIRYLLFDYRYKTGSGKNQSTHRLSALMMSAPLMGHQLTVRGENFMDRLVAFFGFEDINFEYEEFNRAFQVRCDDKKFAYDIFHSDMMEYFLQHTNVCLEWCSGQILIYPSSHRRFDQAEADYMRAFAEGFVQRLPSYLVPMQRGA